MIYETYPLGIPICNPHTHSVIRKSMLYNIKKSSKNLVGNRKRRNFALAFGNEARENLEIQNKVKKLNKNL